MSTRSRPRSTLAVVGVAALVALVTVMLVPAPRDAAAQATFRCGSGQQAASSAIGDRLGDIFGAAGRGSEVVGSGAGTFGTENVNDVFQRCAEPYLSGAGSAPDDDRDDSITTSPGPLPAEFGPDPVGDPGGSGEPHLRTLDGVGYSFQGAGDYVLVRDDGAGIEIQARFGRPTNASPATIVRGAALRVGEHVVTMNDAPAAGSFTADEILIDGEPMAFLPGGWHEGDGFLVLRVDDSIIITTDVGWSVDYTDRTLLVDRPRARAGQPVGLLGDGDGDPEGDVKLADGSSFDPYDTDVLYGAFLDDWFVDGADSLFETPFDVEAEGPIRPAEIVTLDTLPADVVADAAQACAAGGLVAGFGLEQCVYDVSVTGDESWIQSGLGVIHGQGTIDAATLDPELVSSQTLVIEADSPPIAVTGELGGIGTADEYVLAGDATRPRVVRVGESCARVLAPVVTVIVSGRGMTPSPLVCGASVPVPVGDVRLHVIQRFATVGSYAISVGQVGTIDVGPLSDGGVASAELLAEERAVATLDFAAGSAVFLASTADDCQVIGQVTNAAGDVLASGRLCFEIGAVELVGDPPFRLEVVNGSPQAAAFELVATDVARRGVGSGALDREGVLEVTTPGEAPSLAFDLTAGQRIFVENVAPTDLGELTLTDPAGDVIARLFSGLDIGLIEVPATGRYLLTLEPRGSETGEHRVIVHDVPDDPVVPVALGREAVGTVAVPGQQVIFTVRAGAGERLFIDARGEPGIADVDLVAPSGSVLVEALSFGETGPVTVTESGEHRLIVTPRTTATGDYRFVIHRVPPDIVVAAELGDEVSLDITTPGQSATVTFEASAGDDITIEAVADAGLGDVTLFAPSGAVVATGLSFGDLGPLAAPESGTYRLVLDLRGDVVGTQIWRLSG